ncbi:hypothetical protein B0H17DRAFT_1062266 [Mycena rosella]|uniref:Protein kinase domain-containing protein n=1 Tax=Mycena rosella TaxID=1033263 RepID=A0AAD7DI52_MYCRO|nr:hypothetical protein B0H17DRAFT_1062266 [Mycena rosella]
MNDIHRSGVRHLDLRPQNLLLNEAGEATIIDFDRAVINPTKRDLPCLGTRMSSYI